MLERPNNDTAIQDMTPNRREIPRSIGLLLAILGIPLHRRTWHDMHVLVTYHSRIRSRVWRLFGGDRKRRISFCVIPSFSSCRGIQEYFPRASVHPKTTSSSTTLTFRWSLVTGLAPVLVSISESATNILKHPHSSRQSVCVRLVIIGISHSTAAGCSGRNPTSSGLQK